MAVDFGNPYRVLNDVWDQTARALRLTGTLSIDTSSIATAAKQSDGSQKTQLVDAGGEAATVTGGKLDVNASIDTTGLATSANQTTIIGHVDGIETLLTSLDGKNPALGQALAAASVPVVLTAAQITTLTPPAAIAGFATSAKQDTLDTSVNTLLKPASTLTAVTTVTALTGGGIAHDSADSGNPLKIGFKAYSPDGTTPGTAVAESDRTDGKADLDGRQYVNDEHPRWGSYHVDGSSALTDASVAADPGDGFQIVITNICFSSGAGTAINMFLEEGSTKIFGPIYLEAVAGRGFCTPAGFKKHVTASTAVTITTSASIAHSVDIQYIIQAV